jgi:hypothetical protein
MLEQFAWISRSDAMHSRRLRMLMLGFLTPSVVCWGRPVVRNLPKAVQRRSDTVLLLYPTLDARQW